MNFLKKWFKFDPRTSEQKDIDAWLSASSDLADLERRQRMLQRGQAPIQVNANLRYWV
jgi:hypothetical protein